MKKQKSHEPDTIGELRRQADEWKNKYIRALADYQNLEKHTKAREEGTQRYAEEQLIRKLLPVVDNLRTARVHVKDEGLKLIYRQMTDVLSEIGLEEIDVAGLPFDPHVMECIEVVPGNDNTVMEVILPGIRFRGKVVRVAKVKVGKKEIDEDAKDPAKEELRKGDYI
jgi:molecular chaperone GrpE